MLLINGVNVFPSQIEHVLSKPEGITLNYQIIADKKGYMDKLEVDVELDEHLVSDDISTLSSLKKSLEHALLNNLYINVEVKLVAPKSLQRSEGKAIRVLDKRAK
jgi:phenylacetate-CoA ligase